MGAPWVQSYDGSGERICISGEPSVEEQWHDTYGCRWSGETCTLRGGGDGGIWNCPVGTANQANVSVPVPSSGASSSVERRYWQWYVAGGVIAAGIIGIGIYILYDTRRTT